MAETKQGNNGNAKRIGALIAIIVACAAAVAACVLIPQHFKKAATYDGGIVYERDVTDQAMKMKALIAGDDDDAWRESLAEAGFTPETFRAYVIRFMLEDELVAKHANELGVEVTDEMVAEYMQDLRSQYASDAEWRAFLAGIGKSEEQLKEEYARDLAANGAYWAIFDAEENTDSELEEAAREYIAEYGGLKKTYRIIVGADTAQREFGKSAYEVAREARDKIVSGEMTFEEAAARYSSDIHAINDYGYVGWNQMSVESKDYIAASGNVAKGEVSDVLEISGNAEIIWVVDELPTMEGFEGYQALPPDIQEEVREKVSGKKAMADYEDWVDEVMEKENVRIEEMPSSVPYGVKSIS